MHIFFDNGERRIQTISSAHLKLGGNDWSVALGDLVREKFCYETGCDFTEMKEDPDSVAWFEENIEKMKKHLTNHKSSAVAPVFNGCKERIVITEEEFREATSSLLDLTIECVNNMLFGNKNDFELPVDEILIVGGSSKMPQVIDRLGCEYNKPMITCFDPEFSIVKGVALTANELWRRNLEQRF